MTAEYARMEWDRALEAFRSARLLVAHGGFDSAASRAYYAAFHGVTALFALEERVSTKHSALEGPHGAEVQLRIDQRLRR